MAINALNVLFKQMNEVLTSDLDNLDKFLALTNIIAKADGDDVKISFVNLSEITPEEFEEQKKLSLKHQASIYISEAIFEGGFFPQISALTEEYWNQLTHLPITEARNLTFEKIKPDARLFYITES
jgi:hypothetical protein